MKIKENLISILGILLSTLELPLYFIPIFHERGVFDSIDGTSPLIKDFYYTPFENLTAVGYEWIMYIHFALAALSLVLSGVYIFKKTEGVKLSTILFSFLSLMFFIGAVYMASTVHRAY